MACLLGIDVSTTATKALLIDEHGAVVAVAADHYPFETPRPGWTEQHPHLFWDGTVKSIRAVLAQASLTGADVAAVGFTGQMHGMTLLDASGEVVRPCILWNDQRTAAQCAEITRRAGGEQAVLDLTGNPVLTGVLNLFFRAGVSDAHCGMRSFTRDAYQRLNLVTTGMEFASEMVIKAVQAGLRIAEVPITYYPRKGESKLHSFRDGWRHLRFMLSEVSRTATP